MERKTAADFDPNVLILFDAYVHGALDRRGFLEKASKYAVGGITAAMLLDALTPNFAEAQKVAKDDTRIVAEYIGFPSPQGNDKTKGYLVRPAGAKGKQPGVLVVHENRGLNPHIEDIARRLALADFVAFAPDALAPLGGYPGDEDAARELFQKLDQAKAREDFVAAFRFLKAHPSCTGRVGVVGFCWGGGIANALAVRQPDLGAAVPFYGNQPQRRGGGEDQGPAADSLRGDRPAHQRRVARVRSSPEGGQGPHTRPTSIPARSTASTTTPRRATTRRPRRSPGSGPSTSSTRTCGSRSACTGLFWGGRRLLPSPRLRTMSPPGRLVDAPPRATW